MSKQLPTMLPDVPPQAFLDSVEEQGILISKVAGVWHSSDPAFVEASFRDYREPDPVVPREISNFQARAALMGAGLFDSIDSAMKALGPAAVEFQAWEYANFIYRDGVLVNSMAAQFNLTPEILDQLFIAAARIEA
jgi:hypothetical protein